MITDFLNKLKRGLGLDELHNLNKLKKELNLCKSQINELHESFDVLEKAEQDTHFDRLESLYYKEKELSNKFSQLLENYLIKSENSELKYKQAMTKSLGKKRDEMPQVDSENITDFVLHFSNKAGVKKVDKKISSLKPSQDEINEQKVLSIVADNLEDDTDKKETIYIISKDNYILDGHHRWAADLQIDSKKIVKCYKINLSAKKLIKRANSLKMTKRVDIDDNTFKKAITVIAMARAKGFIEGDLLNLVKARTGNLIPVTKTVIKNGKRHSQIFWVAPDRANELRGNVIVRSEEKDNRNIISDYSDENKKKHAKLFERQKTDDSITNVGDRVNVKYKGRTSNENFSFKDLTVVGVEHDHISVRLNEDVISDKKYSDGTKIVFRKGAVIKIPKVNNKKWSDTNNYELSIEDEERQERIKNLTFIEHIQDYAKNAREKGYSIYEDVIGADEEYIKSRYEPFFAKYGKKFDPIKMFDECKEHIVNHFGEGTEVKAKFGRHGFDIYAYKDGKQVMVTNRNFKDGVPFVHPSKTKGMYHALFAINDKKYWGGGLAKKLFCSYYDQYKKMGLEFLSVTAGLQSGPYVWPSFGFYGSIEKATHVLSQFKEGKTREIYKKYTEQDPSVEKAYRDGNKIYIKYVDSQEPVDVTNEMINSSGIDYTQDKEILEIAKQEVSSINESGGFISEDVENDIVDLWEKHVGGAMGEQTTWQEALNQIDRAIQAKEGDKIKKYAVDNSGDVYEPASSINHTITQEEEQEANRVFSDFIRRNPNAKTFPNTLFTANPILRQASKVAYLSSGGASYYVDLTNEAHRKDFEKRIKYNEYIKERDAKQ
jgi:hypothetical protein